MHIPGYRECVWLALGLLLTIGASARRQGAQRGLETRRGQGQQPAVPAPLWIRGGAWGFSKGNTAASRGQAAPQDERAPRGPSGPSSEGQQATATEEPPAVSQLAVDAEDESEAEMGALVIGPESASVPVEAEEEEEEEAVHEPVAEGEVDEDEEDEDEEGEEGVREFSPYGSGDDDDDGSDWDERDEPGASYLQEIAGENEPDWVPAFASAAPEDLRGGADEEEEEASRRRYSREEAVEVLKRLWLRTAVTQHQPQDVAGVAEEEGDEEGEVVNPFRRSSRVSARRLLYRAFSRDLQSDSRVLGGRQWLDKDALVHLRGQALLCQHPEYADLLSGLTPRFSRGFRLVVPGGTHVMHEALAAALAHSVHASLLVADTRRLAAVRRIALEQGVPRSWLGLDTVMAALLELAREHDVDGSPFVLFLADRGRHFLQSKAVAEQLQQELQSKSSRTLFLLSSEHDPDSQLGLAAAGGAASPQLGGQAPPLVGGASGGPGLPEGLVASGIINGSHPGLDQMGGGLPRGIMWPPAIPPNFKATPVLHLMIRPQLGPLPPGMQAPHSHQHQHHPQQLPNMSSFMDGMPMPFRPQHDLKRVLTDLADKFSQLARDRMDSAAASGSGEGKGEEEDEKDQDEDDDEADEGVDPSSDLKNNPRALAQISEMLDRLSRDTDFQQQVSDQLMRLLSTMPPPPPPGSPPQEGQPPMQLPGLHITLMGLVPTNPQQPGQPPVRPPAPGQPQQQQPSGSAAAAAQSSMRSRTWKPFEMWNQRPAKDGEGGKKRKGSKAGSSQKDAAAAGGSASNAPLSLSEMEEVMSLFEDVVLAPTKDAALRARWERLVREDNERHNAKRNFLLLSAGLKQHRMVCPDLTSSNPLLYKVQFKGGAADVSRVILAAVEVDVSSRPTLQQISTEDGPVVVLSQSALEAGLAMVCKTHVQRPGTPVSRTREEVTALAQNRHEHALVANVISPADIGVTYRMIGGLHDVKETLRQCVTYPLKFPHLYSEGIAADSVKGVLLFGPPGTGKTMLAKAVATEGGATFLSVDASVIESKWLGESEKNAKAVFTLARRLAPCVIYLDEVDSILSSRDQGEDTKYNTITSVKTTFMQEWDGLRTTSDRVIVVASTNRPYALDQAVLRRMPRRILVDLPDLETREEMLRVIMSNNRVAPDVNLTAIARRLEGYTGSDIREVCREAVVRIAHDESRKLEEEAQGGVGLEALSNHRLRPVTSEDFHAAMEKLSASVAAKGRELERVREWNNQFGEVRKKQRPPHLSMYL